MGELFPGSGDRQGNSWDLNVDKHRGVVGSEANAAKFRFSPIAVASQGIDSSIGGDASKVLIFVPVLAEDEVSPGCHRQIIPVLQELSIVRLQVEGELTGLL